jgi:subtilisin family serine protease
MAVLNALKAGIVVVASAGNVNTQTPLTDACTNSPAKDGNPNSYLPSDNPNGLSVITVGASTIDDTMASFSKYGTCVDVFAPGQAVHFMLINSADGSADGTSYSAPHVSGVAAIYLQTIQQPNSPSVIEAMIKDYGTPNKLTGLGTGSPNLLLFSGIIRRHACC